MAKPSGQLTVATTVVTTKPGVLTFLSIIAAAADATVTCYNGTVTGDAIAGNAIVAFKVDVSLNGFQGGGNIDDPLEFSNGLVVKVEGTGAVAYAGYKKGIK